MAGVVIGACDCVMSLGKDLGRSDLSLPLRSRYSFKSPYFCVGLFIMLGQDLSEEFTDVRFIVFTGI